jgi:hypothetical protein
MDNRFPPLRPQSQLDARPIALARDRTAISLPYLEWLVAAALLVMLIG